MLVTMSDKEIHHSLASQNVRRNGLSIVTGFLVLKDLLAANAASPATVG